MTKVIFKEKVWGTCRDCEQQFYSAQEYTDHFRRNSPDGIVIEGCFSKPKLAQPTQQ